jgi:hypothetical protein
MATIRRLYVAAALLTLNTALLFVALNVLVVAGRRLSDGPGRPAGALKQYGLERLKGAYPGWSEAQLMAFFTEQGGCRLEYEAFTEYRARPVRGCYINVEPAGYRRIADQAAWPIDPDAFNVFFFGGSTGFGEGLPDDQTLPSRLQAQLTSSLPGRTIHVYNFARPGYYSVQERILFEQLLLTGIRPDLAIFLDGLNDDLAPVPSPGATSGLTGMSDRMRALLERADRASVLQSALELMRDLPLVRWARAAVDAWPGGATPMGAGDALSPDQADRIAERWLANRRLIEAVASSFDISVLFVWQPVPTYRYDVRYHLFADGLVGTMRRAGLAYPRMAAERQAGRLEADVLWLADVQEGRRENLYVDACHYSAGFCGDLAGMIARRLIERGLIAAGGPATHRGSTRAASP